jgi:hypothetical protein
MFWALLFLLVVYIAGTRRKNKIRKALNNYNYPSYDYSELKAKDERLQNFYKFNQQRNYDKHI